MHRCFIEPDNWPLNEVELSPEEAHHLLDVLRGRPGEAVEIFDGCGRIVRAELVGAGKKSARVRILPDTLLRVAPPSPAFTLLQAVARPAGMELIVQKAVELGVTTIVPVTTERTIIKMAAAHKLVRPQISAGQGPSSPRGFAAASCPVLPADKHSVRWRKIALSAAKQCQAAWLPEIFPVVPLQKALAGLAADLKIFGALAPGTPFFREFLTRLAKPVLRNIALAIGPEGDFAEAESRLLLEAGFAPVSFGRQVLRVETAAIFGLSVLNYEFR